jgi:CBS domain-containing protein
MNRTVGQVMTTKVITARADMPFKQLVRLLEVHHVSALPVIDDRGGLRGIVSEADLLLKEEHPEPERTGPFVGRRRRIERSKAAGTVASRIMTTPVVTVGPEASLVEAAATMHRHGVKRLPVVDEGGMLLGIVSRADLLSVFLRKDEDIRRDVLEEVVGRSLWAEPADLRVHVRDGVVSLAGRVETRSQAEAVVSLTHLIEGVVAVRDELTFEVDDRGLRPGPALPWGGVPYGLRN